MSKFSRQAPVVLALLAACGVIDRSATAPSLAAPDVQNSPLRPEEQLARGLAAATSDAQASKVLTRELRVSRHREGKLILQRLLNNPNSASLRLTMTRELAAHGADISELLASTGDLELYAPVKSHRNRVEAGNIAYVATQSAENSDVVAFDASGARTILDRTRPPSAPVLALVRREATDAELEGTDGSAIRVTERASPATPISGVSLVLGDCLEPTDPGCFNGGPGPTASSLSVPATTVPRPNGLYATEFDLTDSGEGWILGDPEIEVWMYGTMYGLYGSSNSGGVVNAIYSPGATYSVPVGCAGNGYGVDGNWRNFNLDNTGWTIPTHKLLFGKPTELYFDDVLGDRSSNNFLLMRRKIWLGAPYRIQVLERDDSRGGCPAVPANRGASFTIGMVGGKFTVNGFDYNDFVAILTTNNDVILDVNYASTASLTAVNGAWLDGPRGRVKVENYNFPASAVGAGQTYLFRAPCIVGIASGGTSAC